MNNSAIVSVLAMCLFLTSILCIGIAAMYGGQGQSAADLIKETLINKGIEAAKKEFIRISTDKDRYYFNEKEFLDLALEYVNTDKYDSAAVVLEMTAEVFPESLSVLRLLAHSYYMQGDEEKSLEYQSKVISIREKAQLEAFLEKQKETLASTAEEVIDRCLEAWGGREAWKAIDTMVVVFSLQDSSGHQNRMIRMYKRPNLFRQGLEGGPSFLAFDGTKFWRVRNGEWKEDNNAHIRLVSMDKWLLDYERIGISMEFVGFDFINGSPVYHVRRTFRDGFVEDLYFSAVTNLLTEIRSDYIQSWPFMKSFLSLWQYKDAEGIKIPYVFIRNLGSLEPPHGGVIEEVRLNIPLDDALFLPPDTKK